MTGPTQSPRANAIVAALAEHQRKHGRGATQAELAATTGIAIAEVRAATLFLEQRGLITRTWEKKSGSCGRYRCALRDAHPRATIFSAPPRREVLGLGSLVVAAGLRLGVTFDPAPGRFLLVVTSRTTTAAIAGTAHLTGGVVVAGPALRRVLTAKGERGVGAIERELLARYQKHRTSALAPIATAGARS